MAVLLELDNISRSFAGVPALREASLEVHEGEVHALVGENGAGKSTLMKVISGGLRADGGILRWRGEAVSFGSPRQAAEHGIALAHQEPLLAPHLTVAENIFLGHEPGRAGGLLLDHGALQERARSLLQQYQLPLEPGRRAGRLTAAERQLLELARGLVTGSSLLILDEPTSSLSEKEAEIVMRTIEVLRGRGTSVIYISHRLEEVRRVAERITILRDGRTVHCAEVAALATAEIIRHMAGRDIAQQRSATRRPPRPELLRVENLSRGREFRDVSFALHAGEILGIAGLIGAGRTEVCHALFGIAPAHSGTIYRGPGVIRIHSPKDARRAGMALLTEDRQRTGVLPGRPVRENVTVAALHRFSSRGALELKAERAAVTDLAKRLRIQTRIEQRVEKLSGGNQQKTLIARWMLTQARIFLFDEPTRGIDVGAKSEVFALMDELAAEGAAVLMVSSEIPELLQVADRLLVMRRGEITTELDPACTTREEVLQWAL
jgi:ABC-type sugar transport system ATPase subunit